MARVRRSRRSKPRWRRRKEARPEEIVAAALDVFVERGYAAARLDEVAHRAGVTKGTIYLYFDSKEALFKAVVRQTIVANIALAEETVAQHQGTTRELLLQLVRGLWELAGRSRLSGIPKLIIAESVNFPGLARFYYEEAIRRALRVFASVLQRGVDSGEFRPLDVETAARLAIAPLVLALVFKHSLEPCVKEPFGPPGYIETHLDLFLRGIAKQPPPEATHA